MLCCWGSSHVLLSCRTDRKPSSERVEKGSSVELQCKYGVIVSSDKISHVITNSTVPATRLSSRSCHDSWGECRKYLSPTFLLGVLFSDVQAGAPLGIPNGACLVDPDSLIRLRAPAFTVGSTRLFLCFTLLQRLVLTCRRNVSMICTIPLVNAFIALDNQTGAAHFVLLGSPTEAECYKIRVINFQCRHLTLVRMLCAELTASRSARTDCGGGR